MPNLIATDFLVTATIHEYSLFELFNNTGIMLDSLKRHVSMTPTLLNNQ